MEFEGDDAKAAVNLARDGIDFLDAIKVFVDPNRLELEDYQPGYGEVRFKTIGIVDDVVPVVVFTFRGETVRIISARKAERNERKKYHEGQTEPF